MAKAKPKSQGEIDQDERIRENIADGGGLRGMSSLSLFEFEDLFEDRDPFEFL